MVVQLVPEAVLMPIQCEETFALGLTLFKRFAEVAVRDLDLEDLVKKWGNLLLSHRCVEVLPTTSLEFASADENTERWSSREC